MSLIYAQMTRMLFKVKLFAIKIASKHQIKCHTYIIHLNMKPITIWYVQSICIKKKIVAT